MKKYELTIGKTGAEVTIIKKNKKSCSIYVKSSKIVMLYIPLNISYSYGLSLVAKKSTWIEQKLKKYLELDEFQGVYFIGEKYYIKLEHSDVPIKIEDNNIIFNDLQNKDFILNSWYISKATELVNQILLKYTAIMNLYPKKIKIKKLKSAWGICYSNGTITFNLHLIKLPIQVITYLIIHELGHLKHHNHSKEYWEYISLYIKDPKLYRKWLRKNDYKYIRNSSDI